MERSSVSTPVNLSGWPERCMLLLLALMASTAYAAGSNMPWEGPLQSVLESIEGPVARIVAVIIIIVTGLTLAFGDTPGGFRRLIQIVFEIGRASCRERVSQYG